MSAAYLYKQIVTDVVSAGSYYIADVGGTVTGPS